MTMTDIKKPLFQQIQEIEAEYGINVAELRRRGAAARQKAKEQSLALLANDKASGLN